MPIPHDFPPGAGDLRPFTRDTRLCRFLVLPTALLRWGLSPGAVLVYALLLDRAKLSQRSGWTDKRGWVYTVFPIQALCQALGRGETTLKRWIRELEARELIFRTVPLPGGTAWTFVQVPKFSVAEEGTEEPHQVRDPGRNPPGPPAPGSRPKTTSTGCSRPSRRSYPHPRPNPAPVRIWRTPGQIWPGEGPNLAPYSSNLTK